MKVVITSKYVQAPNWLRRFLTKRGYAQITITETSEAPPVIGDCAWCGKAAYGIAWDDLNSSGMASCGNCGNEYCPEESLTGLR